METVRRMNRSGRTTALTAAVIAGAVLWFGCSRGRTRAEPEPAPEVRVDLSPLGLPRGFFSTSDDAPRTIIGYRTPVAGTLINHTRFFSGTSCR